MEQTIDIGPVTCRITNDDVKCMQPAGTIPRVTDERSFVKLVETCDVLDNTSDDKINEAACTSFKALVLKKNFLKPPSLQETIPCKWTPGKDRSFGYCMPNADALGNVAFKAFYES